MGRTQPEQPCGQELGDGYKDADTLRRLYHDEGLSIGSIADEFGVGNGTIQYWMEKFDIETRQAPQEKDAWTDVECDNCGDTFEKRKWMVQRSDDDFCSRECKHNIGRETTTCDFCGDEFIAPVCYVENGFRDFCSDDCYRESASERYSGEESPVWRRREVSCEWCGDPVQRAPSQLSDRNFCSKECQRLWKRETDYNIGANHPNWAGGDIPYGAGWDRNRRRARERDNYECQFCGLASDAHKLIHGEDLHVHHVVKARLIEEDSDRNALDNLISLCRSCHLDMASSQG